MDFEKEYDKYLNRMAHELLNGNVLLSEVKILDFEEFKREVLDEQRRKGQATRNTAKKGTGQES